MTTDKHDDNRPTFPAQLLDSLTVLAIVGCLVTAYAGAVSLWGMS